MKSSKEKQAEKRALNISKGLCRICPKKLFSGGFCKDCFLRSRLQSRKATGSQPWKPGGRGRPPKSLD